METTPEQTLIRERKKTSFLKTVIAFLLAIGIIFLLCYYIDGLDKKLKDKEAQSEILKNNYIRTSFLKDSIAKENKKLSLYKSLTDAMNNRDIAIKDLKKQVGDFLYLKIDSSKVILTDIIVGGGKNSYYIEYRILTKNKTVEYISPELVY